MIIFFKFLDFKFVKKILKVGSYFKFIVEFKQLFFKNNSNSGLKKLNIFFVEHFLIWCSFIIWLFSEFLHFFMSFNFYNLLITCHILLPFHLFFCCLLLFFLYYISCTSFFLSRFMLYISYINLFIDGLFLNFFVLFFYSWQLIMNFLSLFSLDFINVLWFKFWFFNVNFVCSLDFFSYIMVLLTIIVYFGVFLAMFSDLELKLNLNNSLQWFLRFFLISLICQSMLLFFLMWDIFLMFFFFELSILPLCGLLGKWGYANKYRAFLFLIIYTILSSLCFMFLIIVSQWVLGLNLTWFYWLTFNYNKLNIYSHLYLSLLLIVSATLKLPVIPFHIWLPEAHVESPTVGSMLLAGILLKAGVYLLYRFMVLFFINGELSLIYMDLFIFGGFISSLISFFLAFSQIDFKWCIAYLSIAHMSLVFIGLLTPSFISKLGCFLMSFSHGIIASTLFYFSGFLMYWYGTWSLLDFRGFMEFNPHLGLILGLIFINNSGLPGTLSFWAELLILFGLSFISFKYAYFMVICMFFNGLLNFYLFSLVILGNFNYLNFEFYRMNWHRLTFVSINFFFLYLWFLISLLGLFFLGIKEFLYFIF